jgi:hypothetical protein
VTPLSGRRLRRVRGRPARRLGNHLGPICLDHHVHATERARAPGVQPQRPVAQRLDLAEVMADQDHCAAFVPHATYAIEALGLEGQIPDGEYLVDEEDGGLGMGGDRKTEAELHATAVGAKRGVGEGL